MSNMQRLSYLLAIVLAVLLGILIATALFGGSSSPTPTPAPTVNPTVNPSGFGSPSASASDSLAPSSSGAATPTPPPTAAPAASATPAPTPTPIPPATVTFSSLRLDAATDATGNDRIITWATRTTQPITVAFTATGGSANACLFVGTKQVACKAGASGSLSATATGSIVTMTLRLRGVASATPVVSATLGFVAINPSVTIQHARFDGTAAPDYNGIQVVVKPRKAGVVKLTASWGGHPFMYEVDLIEQGGPGLKSLANQGPATNVSTSLALVPPNGWMIVLQNTEAGFGATDLTATVSWP